MDEPSELGSGEPAAMHAGAAVVDITPVGSIFLFGYPHVPRQSTGVHDPLECAAFYVRGGSGEALFIANDLIYFSRDFAMDVRRRISAVTRLPVDAIMITATHTHSGPVMTDNLSNFADSVVPKADPAYLSWAAGQMVVAARAAVERAEPAELGLAVASVNGIGTNRHDPTGPADPQVPVLMARSLTHHRPIACMVIYGMHPTVLHEDSTVVSADFPGFTRRWLRGHVLPEGCPVLYHLGAGGDQSPRHVTRANTLAEAQRIGESLGRQIEAAIDGLVFFGPVDVLDTCRALVPVEPRNFPAVEEAQDALRAARRRYEELRATDTARQEVRSAECDVFGAEKTAFFAQAGADGRLATAFSSASPAEIQLIRLGPWTFVGWPGEFFVEYALALKQQASEGTYLVTLANGELQGYVATPAAIARGYYEASNAIFSVRNGTAFVEATLALIADSDRRIRTRSVESSQNSPGQAVAIRGSGAGSSVRHV